MKLLTRFQSAYDKYLFEGIIDPADYYNFMGTSLNGSIVEQGQEIQEESIACLYVLNTLDHNTDLNFTNPENIVTKFFSSMGSSVQKNILLISIQPLKVLHAVIDYFTTLEKSLRPEEEVIIYNISANTVFNMVQTGGLERSGDMVQTGGLERSGALLPTGGLDLRSLYSIINSYGKHTFIDLSLAVNAIELFKRRKTCKNAKELYSKFGDRKVKIGMEWSSASKSPELRFITKFDILNYSILHKFMDNGTFGLRDVQGYKLRLVPLIPKANYRIFDKLETFRSFASGSEAFRTELPDGTRAPLHSELLKVHSCHKILIIRTSFLEQDQASAPFQGPVLSFKNMLYISLIDWKSIFIESSTRPEDSIKIYETLSDIHSNEYNLARKEINKLNPDYSLLRTDEEIKTFENDLKVSGMRPPVFSKPSLILDDYDGIKNYLKRLEASLKVDNIELQCLEI